MDINQQKKLMPPLGGGQSAVTRVLVIYAGHIGDLVMATPVLEHLRSAFGENVCIDWLARRSCGGIIGQDPRVNRIFTIDHMKLPVLLNWPKMRVILYSWRHPYDLVISLNFDDANSLLCALQAQQKITPDKNTCNSKIHKVEEMQEYYLQKLFPNQATTFLAPALSVPAHCHELDLPSQFLVLVVTISKHKSKSKSGFKRWPMNHWRELIVLLLKRYPGKVLLTHAPNERGAIDDLLSDFQPRLQAISPKLDDLIGILKRADVVVSADTGPAHIANAIGTPTVTLFGPSRPEKTGPYNKNKSAVILKADLDCTGCLLQIPCSSNRCMLKLTPTEVCHALLGQLYDTASSNTQQS